MPVLMRPPLMKTVDAAGMRQQLRIAHRRRVERHLVATGEEHRPDVGRRAHAPADGVGDEDLLRRPGGHVEHGGTVFVARRDVEEDELVGSGSVVRGREFDRIARVAQLHEADTLHDAPLPDIETRDDALGEHDPSGP
jgi:hypothetical protein